VTDSILTNVKKTLGLVEANTDYDPEIILFINGVFSTLNQLGIGPETGFSIVDKVTTWDALIGTNPKLNSVKTYVYLKVRLLFDPPQTSYLVDAFNQQAKELEWRLNSVREETAWVDPSIDLIADDDLVLDGGTP
jgi:hypothetical protein